MLLYLFLLSLFVAELNGARILCVYPMASISHQVVFRELTLELVKEGHELVVVTPNPVFPKDRPKDNVTEIDSSEAYEIFKALIESAVGERGVVIPSEDTTAEEYQVILLFLQKIMENPEFKAIIDDPKQKFDLIIGEAMYLFPLSLGNKYDAPVIWFSSFYGFPSNYAAAGAPTRHPLLHPSPFRLRLFNLSLWEKIKYVYKEWKFWYEMDKLMNIEYNMMKAYLGDDATLDEILNRLDLLFVNANPVFEGNRPVPPNVVHLGRMHLKPVKELPKELKSFLDNSKRGVIYMSLGTNVRFSLMTPDLIDAFVDAVEAMPFDVLWKFDGTDLPRRPKNAKIEKWFPQRDLLHHPNIKAFITQGGLQSADETIDAGVPVVVLPVLGDQWYNAEQYERLGVGIELDVVTLTAEQLVEAVNTVVSDKSYRRNMQKLSTIVKDEIQSPVERAVWWTNYVLRHGGAKHLRPPTANISWQEYFMIDVVAVVLAVSTVVAVITSLALWVLCRLVSASKGSGKKLKKT